MSRRRRHTAIWPGLNSATSISSTLNPTAPRSSTRRSSAPGSANRRANSKPRCAAPATPLLRTGWSPQPLAAAPGSPMQPSQAGSVSMTRSSTRYYSTPAASLPTYFKDAGWRTVDIAPGIKAPSARATAAWGFDREIFASEPDYKGPSFGWFAIPDQFTLDRAATIRSTLGPAPPVFTQLVLVSSHIPFAPVPPYLADWDDSRTFASIPEKAMEEV